MVQSLPSSPLRGFVIVTAGFEAGVAKPRWRGLVGMTGLLIRSLHVGDAPDVFVCHEGARKSRYSAGEYCDRRCAVLKHRGNVAFREMAHVGRADASALKQVVGVLMMSST